ncbi:small ribosomal subunit protein eS4, X isoform isoform X1 [Bos mutus]
MGAPLQDLARAGLALPGPHFRTRLRGILGSGATPTAQATGKRRRRLRAPLPEQSLPSPAGGCALKAAWSLYRPTRRLLPSAIPRTSVFSFNRHGQPLRDLLIPTAQHHCYLFVVAPPPEAPLSMARGPKKHLKRVAAPKHWMLDKLTGVFAPRPSTGPHKLRECLPLIIFLRNRLKYALTGDEVKKICMQRFIKIDGKVRTDVTYPAGFMDVISIDKIGENFRLIYDTKGRFAVHRITPEEAKYKLCKVRKIFVGTKGIPHLVTHDARTIRYPDPLIKVNDTIQIDLETGKITDFIKFDTGNLCMVTGGANLGRIGVITNRERHPGSFDVVHVKDANGNSFATRLSNIFVIGKGNKPWISLPRGKGIRLTIAEERDKRLAAKQSSG